MWEEVQHGLISGSPDFAVDIRSRLISEEKAPELPQYTRLAKALSPNEMLNRGCTALDFDVGSAAAQKRISASEKDKRDWLIYLLRENGSWTNQEIGSCSGLTYSAVRRRVGETKKG